MNDNLNASNDNTERLAYLSDPELLAAWHKIESPSAEGEVLAREIERLGLDC